MGLLSDDDSVPDGPEATLRRLVAGPIEQLQVGSRPAAEYQQPHKLVGRVSGGERRHAGGVVGR